MGFATNKPDIAIYGLGNIGKRLLKFCGMKGLNVVAVYNRPGDKVGQDAGRVAGLPHDLGVLVENGDTADFSTCKADIALIATNTDLLAVNFPIYKRFLKAGINVLCHATQAYNPFFENKAIASEIDRLAKENGVTFTGSAIWDSTRVWSAIVAAGTCVDIESVTHTSTAEMGRQGAHFEAFTGVGMTVEDFNKQFSADANSHPLGIFLHLPAVLVLQKIGCEITRVEKTVEPIVFDESVYSPFTDTTFPAGKVIGTRIIAQISTREGIDGFVKAEYRLFREGDIEDLSWHIKGLPGLKISVERDDTANLSATSLFNRIPDVLAAQPGIVEFIKMGPLTSSALV